ncbi:hypothetical protein SAMN05216421_0473 [Halopseudomonas xinjiangensis]|uniref:Oxidase n=1 Tax=Halopseudomonas xinjiangensis TaxID=487184 RepID=A0A1H1MIM1_9GAMM|nr:hypothetical protein [Halopseudomonas xinjiangensis]SDR86598.1 hypothetical protein SAMN05216421_0473 [Halopseudomonas xinjiangensis]
MRRQGATHSFVEGLVNGRVHNPYPMVSVILSISFVLLALVVLVSVAMSIPPGDLTRDPTAVAGVRIYIGFLSQVGIFFWSTTATLCLFVALVIPGRAQTRRIRGFFVAAGALTLMLGLDDVFLLHEHLFPFLGVNELVVLGVYGLCTVAFLLYFHKIILNSEFLLLTMALVFFGASVVIDVLDIEWIDPYLLEDGAKLIGLVSWTGYFFRTALAAVQLHPWRQASVLRATAPAQERLHMHPVPHAHSGMHQTERRVHSKIS